MVILWDFKNQREIARLLGHQLGVGTVAFNPDGKTLVSGSNDQLLIVWDVMPDPLDQDHPESWLKPACQRASRLLTQAELETYFPNQEHKQACETILGGE
jgi:WD40 repeat protein